MKNGVLFQGFEWYLPDDGTLYTNLIEKVSELKSNGISAIWLPPISKATSTSDVGYGIYDLYDLGEFNQKGSVRTKYGTKEELLRLIKIFHQEDIQVYADIVLNHKAGADRTEMFKAVKVDPMDRNTEIGSHDDIQGWTAFDFPGRGNAYSSFKWNFRHFSGVDKDEGRNEEGVFKILGENKEWSPGVSTELGNYDYLMYADIDHKNQEVIDELLGWMYWFIDTTGIDGIRLDAIKHIDYDFIKKLIAHIEAKYGKEFYLLGEYWVDNEKENNIYLEEINYRLDLFDVVLHFNLRDAAVKGSEFDLREIFTDSLVEKHPALSVTFVDNHDSQPGQALESWIGEWFKESAYGLILLRKDGYPCVFYGDYYGINDGKGYTGINGKLQKLLNLRMNFLWNEQIDYFENKNFIGWVRSDAEGKVSPAAIILSNAENAALNMYVGENEKGKTYKDFLGNNDGIVIIDEEGKGTFPVTAKTISVWMEMASDKS